MAFDLGAHLVRLGILSSTSDHTSVVSINLFVALLCTCIVIGHLLEENRWMNESITALAISLLQSRLTVQPMPGDDVIPTADPPVAEMAAASLSPAADPALEPARQRTFIKSIVVGGAAMPEELVGRKVVVGGWVKTGREQGKGTFAFLELNDGSCLANLQVIVDAEVYPLSQLVATGTCVLVEGVLKKPPEGTKQRVELKVEKVLEVGPVDPSKYPLPKTKLTLEFLRDFVHLRSRTNTVLKKF